MNAIYFTNSGKREENQDFVLLKKLNSGSYLYLISDGMGAYDKGDIAAQIIAENIFVFLNQQKEYDESIFQKAADKANFSIRQFNDQEKIKSGAAIGGVVLHENSAHVFWVGDVFIGVIRSDSILFENKRHTMIDGLLDSKIALNPIDLDRYRHIVTRSISGNITKSIIGYKEITLTNKDQVVICSDGVVDTISIEEFLLKGLTFNELELYLTEYSQDNFSFIQIDGF